MNTNDDGTDSGFEASTDTTPATGGRRIVMTDGGACANCGAALPAEIEPGTGVYCPECGHGQHPRTDGGTNTGPTSGHPDARVDLGTFRGATTHDAHVLELHGSTGSATITVPPQYAEKLVAVTDSLPSRLVTDGGVTVERLYCELCNSEFESLDDLADHPGCGPTHEEDEEEDGEDGGRVAVADGGRRPLAAWSHLTGFQRDILRVLGDEPRYGLAIKDQLEAWWGEEINHGRLYPNLDQLVEAGLVTKAELDKRTNEYALTDWGATVVSVALGRDADLDIESESGRRRRAVADGHGGDA